MSVKPLNNVETSWCVSGDITLVVEGVLPDSLIKNVVSKNGDGKMSVNTDIEVGDGLLSGTLIDISENDAEGMGMSLRVTKKLRS